MIGAALTATIVVALAAGPVDAAQSWTVTSNGLNLVVGQSANVTLTIKNTSSNGGGGSGIGCVEIGMPSAFVVTSATVVSVTNGLSWSAAISASSPHGVVAHGDSNGDRLRGDPDDDTLVLKIGITAKTLGIYTWTATRSRTRTAPEGSVIRSTSS